MKTNYNDFNVSEKNRLVYLSSLVFPAEENQMKVVKIMSGILSLLIFHGTPLHHHLALDITVDKNRGRIK